MRILILSDTHGNFPLAVEACHLAEPFDLLIHLGDGNDDVTLLRKSGIGECINVSGNCDLGSAAPRELVWEGVGKKILLTHGDIYGVKRSLRNLLARSKELGVDITLYGHTHLPLAETIEGILFVNPGALAKTQHDHSCALLEIMPDGGTSVTHLLLS